MRPHNFYPRMPHGQGFQQVPHQMPQFQPRQMPPGMMPPGFQMPKTGALPPGSGTFMETASRFLSTAQNFQPLIQQATPLIQQATPMIKNLPALWKLYKGFQSSPNAQNENEFDDSSFYESPRRNDFTDQQLREDRARSSNRERNEKKPSNRGPYPSVPRIYQPPYDFD